MDNVTPISSFGARKQMNVQDAFQNLVTAIDNYQDKGSIHRILSESLTSIALTIRERDDLKTEVDRLQKELADIKKTPLARDINLETEVKK